MSETVKALLKGKLNTAITLSLLVLFVWMASVLLPWGLFNAVFAVDLNACREARGQGACWGVVGEKWKLIIFGRYPFEEAWRPVVASLLMVAACIAICQRQLWRPSTFIAAALVLVGSVALMVGGFAGLSHVPTERLGGLALTLLLAILGNILSLPLAVLLALGRTSDLPFIRAVCTSFIEIIRGVPLITVLFMASFMFPLFMPSGTNPDVLLRVAAGLIIFSAAYQA